MDIHMSTYQTECSALDWNTFQGLLSQMRATIYHEERTSRKHTMIRMRLLTVLGGYWGLRAGDLLQLQWSQIINKQAGDKISIKEGKTGKIRIISVQPEVVTLIGESFELFPMLNIACNLIIPLLICEIL